MKQTPKAWHKTKEKMYCISNINYLFSKVKLHTDNVEDSDWYSFDDVITLESTDLQGIDSQSREKVDLYEGDVILDNHLNDGHGEYYVLVKQNNYIYPKLIKRGKIMNNVIDPMMFSRHARMNGVERVGNIYEYPELLEGK